MLYIWIIIYFKIARDSIFQRTLPEILKHELRSHPISASKGQILQELATCIKGAIDADDFNLYMTSEAHQDLYKYEKNYSEEDLPWVQFKITT